MLVLKRREREVIYIGNDIILKVIKIERKGVHIGIEAPINIQILREELMPSFEIK